MRLVAIITVLCMLRMSMQKVDFHEEKVTPMNRISCVRTALKKYIAKHSSIVLFTKNSNNIVNSLFKIPLFVITKWDSQTLSGRRGAMVIFLKGNANQDFDDLKPLQGFVLVQPVLIVCITDAICASNMYMMKIVDTVTSPKMHYVAIDERGIIEIYEYTTTNQDSCGIKRLSKRGHCSSKLIAKKTFQKSMNFHGCPMRVITRLCLMYPELRGYDRSSPFCRLEGAMVRIIAKTLNATTERMEVETLSDLRQLVAKRYADLGFGQLYGISYEGISNTVAFLFIKATVVAPRSTRALGGLMGKIFLPLNPKVWLGIAGVVVFILILRTLVPFFRRPYILQLYGMLIGMSQPETPRALPYRIYFLSLTLFAYFCSQIYLTNLTKVLSTAQQEITITLDDLENSDIRVEGTHETRETFKHDYPRIYNDFRVVDYQEYHRNFLELLTGRSNSAFYVVVSDEKLSIWKTVKALKDAISWYPIVMVTPNSSAITETTSRVLATLTESGIVHKYVTLLSMEERLSMNKNSTSSARSLGLKFDELKGIFFVFVSGLSLSFLVFLIEILTAFVKTSTWFKRRSIILSEWLSQRRVRGILFQRQKSPKQRN